MKNLEQIRAASALDFANSAKSKTGTNGGEVVKKLLSLIMNNGLLAAGAFAFQKQQDQKQHGKKDNGFYTCFCFIAQHLAHPEIKLVPDDCKTLENLLNHLVSDRADSETLKLVTSESLAWLGYARRFVKKDEGEDETDSDGV